MLNRVIVQGRLVADPELRQTQQNVPVTSFRIACDRDFSKGETKQVDFLSITAWRSTAEFVSNHFHKGDMILILGSIQQRKYADKETGKELTTYDILLDKCWFCGGKNEKATAPVIPDGFSIDTVDVDLPF